jgi:O-antigen/teichoic acid export membrane protein
MSKATEMAQVSAKGGFHLLWGLVASTVISAVGTIVIARILGADSYGLYAIALTAPNLLATFRDWGVNTAMVKYSAQYNRQADVAKIRSVFASGILFELVTGLVLSLVAFGFSDLLAANLQRPSIAPLIQIVAFFILTAGLVNTATAAFTGLEKMHLNSVMLIIQSIAKTALIIAFALLGLGTFGAVLGFTIAVLIAAIIGILLVWTMYRSMPKPVGGKLELLATTKMMLKYGLPLSIGAILAGFVAMFYNYLMAFYVTDNALIGNYNVALNFVVLITFFATPVTTMLFPAFSKLDAKKDSELLKSVFQYSVKYAALIVVPVAALIMALATPAIGTIFGNAYSQAPLFLALGCISYLFAATGNLSVAYIIISQGDTPYNLKMTLISVVLGFPLSFLLISQLGIIGVIFTTTVVTLPSLFLSLRFSKKKYGVSIDWLSSAKILFSSAIAGLLTYLLINSLAVNSLMQLIIGVIAFVVVYLFAAVFTKTINKSDLINIRNVVNALGPLRKPLGLVLKIIEKLINILNL